MEKVMVNKPEWKKTILALKKEHYGDGERKQVAVSTARFASGPSRNDLMMTAKQMQIKNFRILNKAELTEVIAEETSKERRDTIIAQAVIRWKEGFGKNKK